MANEIKKYANFESLQVFKENADRIYALKSEIGNVDLSAYETKEDSILKYDELNNVKKDKDLIVTYQEGSTSYATHSSEEILEAVNNGRTVKFQKELELLNLLEITVDYATFYIAYINMNGKLQQKIVVISGNSIAMEQDDTYDYVTSSALNAKQDILTGTEGQVVQFDADGKAVALDLNLITVDDIDTICGGTIQYANDVMF